MVVWVGVVDGCIYCGGLMEEGGGMWRRHYSLVLWDLVGRKKERGSICIKRGSGLGSGLRSGLGCVTGSDRG